MNDAPTPLRRQRATVRLFVAGHVAALLSIYGVAVAVGGGFAGPPFPPDTVVVAQAAGPRPAALPATSQRGLPFDDARRFVPERHDVAPPWAFDADGRLHTDGR